MKKVNRWGFWGLVYIVFISCNPKSTSVEQVNAGNAKADTIGKTSVQAPPPPEKSKEEKEMENLKSKYKHIEAKYVSFFWGDSPHYNFIDANGREYDFSSIKDYKWELTKLSPDVNGGEAINPKYKNKRFTIFYKNELLMNDIGEKEDRLIAVKLFLKK